MVGVMPIAKILTMVACALGYAMLAGAQPVERPPVEIGAGLPLGARVAVGMSVPIGPLASVATASAEPTRVSPRWRYIGVALDQRIVVFGDRQSWSGVLRELHPDSLTLDTVAGSVVLPRNQICRVIKPYPIGKSTTVASVIMGAVIIGAIARHACHGCTTKQRASVAALGAGLGANWGRRVPAPTELFLNPAGCRP